MIHKTHRHMAIGTPGTKSKHLGMYLTVLITYLFPNLLYFTCILTNLQATYLPT